MSPQFLLTVGGILLLALLTAEIGRRTFLPRVTLLLIFGIFIGQSGLNLIPDLFTSQFELIANMALLMVGFLIGGKLTMHSLKGAANKILLISLSQATFTMLFVSLGLFLAGVQKEIAILLGCIASATAPAAIFDVVEESEDQGPFTQLLLSIVAIDDAWALILFGIGVAFVASIAGHEPDAAALIIASKEIGGGILLGIAIGFPAAYLTGRLRPGQPILSEALGLVFVCGGIALWFEVSFLIASMTLGMIIANFARHHEYAFHEIEGIEWPFMAIFFVLAGATLEFEILKGVGVLGFFYVLFRIIGKVIGTWFGCQLSMTDKHTGRWLGVAMLPQAGVAIGMTLVAANYFPEYRQTLLTVVISATIFFELFGPVLTRMAIQKHKH
jgi:Kef-type K+ transport system membrane component KefB